MDVMLPSRLACCAVVVALVFAACGGKTIDNLEGGPPNNPAGDTGTETGTPTVIDAGGRICPSNCTVGHQCCEGTCSGIPASMYNSCCNCLPGEVDSIQCPKGKCGS
jgi:hypothetical protein